MQLRRLTALEADKIRLEHEDLVTKIADYKDILGRRERVFGLITDELKVSCGSATRLPAPHRDPRSRRVVLKTSI